MIRNSIRNKLIVFLLAATIMPISTSIVITYYFTKQAVSNETIQSNSNLIYQGKTNIMNYLKAIEQNSLNVYNDNTLYTIIYNGDTDYLSYNETVRGLQTIANSVKEIKQIYLYMAKSNRSILISQGNPNRNDSPGPKYQPEMNNAEVKLQPTHWNHDYKVGSLFYFPPTTVVTMHRTLLNSLTQERLGILSIDFSIEVIKSISEQLYTLGQDEFYILDNDGAVIYSTNPKEWGQVLQEPWVDHLLSMPESSGSFEWKSKPFTGIHIYDRMSTPYMEWTLVKRIPYEHLYKNARDLTKINTLIFILFMVVVISATLYISFRFTSPIKNLMGYISKIQSGNMQVDIQVTSNDEIGILARRFRMMMQTINNLIEREYKLDIANKTNQLKALQAQINPHFLYNGLQSIGTLALQHQAPKIYSLISSLARMMRYNMNTNETLVPLRQEIDHIKSYLELQMQRFEDELDVTFQVTEQTLDILIPKMILQPLVENYFKHGFDPREKKGALLIAGEITEDNQLKLIVEDNGRGIDPKQLIILQKQLSLQPDEIAETSESIGLLNVHLRLQLYFQGASMKLDPCYPTGVRVTLVIPNTQQISS
ncbi:HAMP domain-containing protein [Paenibacillus sp. LMG 31456]|uniref:HAMP domain-containing protein n=1 Tax=Paenibacillus foliorum TaxID=2654974 RepID=A0A972GKU2_9BACL|nr:sensor histidine kinase [Paenibacillus foliorum]NOU92173.1 HAMP domain-containing protein [Paenibacillus foliorum]